MNDCRFEAEIQRLRQEAEMNRLRAELEAKNADMLRQTMQAQQAHPVPHEEQGGVLVQAAMELQAKDAAAEIERIRYVCPL